VRESAVDKAMDAVRDKFGAHSVMRGKLLERDGTMQNDSDPGKTNRATASSAGRFLKR
jgi:hypothetical protein